MTGKPKSKDESPRPFVMEVAIEFKAVEDEEGSAALPFCELLDETIAGVIKTVTSAEPDLTETIFNLPVSMPKKAQMLVRKVVGPLFV
jgi:hypothetical protein